MWLEAATLSSKLVSLHVKHIVLCLLPTLENISWSYGRELNIEPQKLWKVWRTPPVRGLRDLGLFNLEKSGLGWDLILLIFLHLGGKEGAKSMELGSFQGCPVPRNNKTQKVHSEHHKTLWYCVEDGTIAQISHRNCGLCLGLQPASSSIPQGVLIMAVGVLKCSA